MEDSVAQPHSPGKPKGGKKNRNRKKNKRTQALATGTDLPHEADPYHQDNDLKHDTNGNYAISHHNHQIDTPSTAPPAYTSMPHPASIPAPASVSTYRAPSPTAQSNLSFDSADSQGRRRRRPRGGRKQKSKAVIQNDEELLNGTEEQQQRERVELPPVGSRSGRRRAHKQQEVEQEQQQRGVGSGPDGYEEEAEVHRDLSGYLYAKDTLEDQEQERDQTNGVILGVDEEEDEGICEGAKGEAEPSHRVLKLAKEQASGDNISAGAKHSQPAPKVPFETGFKAFSIRKATPSQSDKPPITITTVEGGSEPTPGNTKKEKKPKNKDKKKAKPQSNENDPEQARAPPAARHPALAEADDDREDEAPAAQEQPSTGREVRIKLDLNLEIEVLLRTKIKGEIMITFM